MPLVIRILGTEATYAIEDPGYPLTHHVFFHNNREAIPIGVDEEGMDVRSLQHLRRDSCLCDTLSSVPYRHCPLSGTQDCFIELGIIR